MFKEGLNQYKERDTKGFEKELNQMHYKLMFVRFNKIALTQKQHIDALRSLMLLMEKQCGKIKGCMCVTYMGNIPSPLPHYNSNLPLTFLVIMTQLFSWMIIINDFMCILTGSPR